MNGVLNYDLIFLAADSANVLSYFANSNIAGKAIVVLLVVLSMLAWTVMFGKWMDLGKLKALNTMVERKLEQVDSVFQINPGKGEAGPYAALLKAALDAYERYIQVDTDKTTCIGHVENALQRAVADQTHRYESKMIWLGSIVTSAPFLGLLGTVWGVMDAFGGMALQSTATLQNLAPGVSGALLTTVAGLIVAIPSVVGYNALLTKSKLGITELENFASSLADRVELEVSAAIASQRG